MPSSGPDGKPGTEHRLLGNKLSALCRAMAHKLRSQSHRGSSKASTGTQLLQAYAEIDVWGKRSPQFPSTGKNTAKNYKLSS